MNEMLTVMECPDLCDTTDHVINTVTGVATCQECQAETQLGAVELVDILA